MEYLRIDQQRAIQNIKAASDFNWIRDGEHSNKLFFMQTKTRIKQNRIPDLRQPNGQLTNNPMGKNRMCQTLIQTLSVKDCQSRRLLPK